MAVYNESISLDLTAGFGPSGILQGNGAISLPATLGLSMGGTVFRPKVYPSNLRGLTFTVVKTPEFSTLIQSSPNRYELRLPQTLNPIWHWSLVYDYLKDYDLQGSLPYTDLQTLMGFFLARQGAADDFLFSDPDDHAVGPAMTGSPLAPNPLAQLELVTDGAGNWYSPIQRNLGGFYEDITDLDGEIAVYANGVLQTKSVHYTVEGPGLALPGKSFAGLYLAWTSEPTTPITAEFDFRFRVRFEMDQQDFEKFLSQLWTIGGHGQRGAGEVRLMTSRPANPASPTMICVTQECPTWVPVPAPTSGLRRIIIGPRACGSNNGSCGSASATCSPEGSQPGTANEIFLHQSPFGDGPSANWSNFSLPSWLSPSKARVWYRVMVLNWEIGEHTAVGGIFFDVAGSGGTYFGTGSNIFVTGPFDATGVNWSALTAGASIAGTLENPVGYCYPCGSSGECTMTLGVSAVFLVVDYEP